MSHPDSTHEVLQVPDEAVEAGIRVASEDLGFDAGAIVRERIERVLTAALPSLETEIRERIRLERVGEIREKRESVRAEITKGLRERLETALKRLRTVKPYEVHNASIITRRSVADEIEAALNQPPIGDEGGLDDLKFGPRSYTPEQAKVIAEAAENRQALPAQPVGDEEAVEQDQEALTRIEIEALLNRRTGGTAEELAELEEAERSGREKLWRALGDDGAMKLKISGGGDPAGMNDAIYANEVAAQQDQEAPDAR